MIKIISACNICDKQERRTKVKEILNQFERKHEIDMEKLKEKYEKKITEIKKDIRKKLTNNENESKLRKELEAASKKINMLKEQLEVTDSGNAEAMALYQQKIVKLNEELQNANYKIKHLEERIGYFENQYYTKKDASIPISNRKRNRSVEDSMFRDDKKTKFQFKNKGTREADNWKNKSLQKKKNRVKKRYENKVKVE